MLIKILYNIEKIIKKIKRKNNKEKGGYIY